MKILKDILLKRDDWFTCPQCDFIQDNDGRIIVDYVGKFENLQNDFNTICQKIHVESTQLPHINRSKTYNPIINILKLNKNIKKHYSEYYDSETKEFVAHIYKDDIKKFEYCFDEKN